MSPNLFVYGTLRKGSGTAMSQSLAEQSAFVGRGRTRGTLYQLKRYPAMVLQGDQWVAGEVYRLNDPGSLLPVLDAYEQPREYKRRLVLVRLERGKAVRAWAYIYRLGVADKRLIASGDYFRPV